MTIRLYNSRTRKVDELTPRNPGHLDMFVCGPTVYDRVHLGNARTFTIFDVVAKWLRHRGYDVRYIQNVTDIDDKIIKRAAEAGVEPLEYARTYDEYFRADMLSLGNTAVTEYLRATDHIPQVITQVKSLRDRGNAYLIENDGWYFDISSFPDYGKLSGRTGVNANDAVSRIDDSDKKRTSGDFCLWKLSKPGEPTWSDAELGAGRPGWHIEDTAITESVFGPQYDIHGGGMDLKFPHHEAEIAQQEASSGLIPFVRYWMHAGFLEANSEKMSKSIGNFSTLHETLQTVDPAVLRFYFLSNHYRSPLEFNDTSLNAAHAAVGRIGELARKSGTIENFSLDSVEAAMDNDFNTAEAFAAIFTIIRDANSRNVVPAPAFFEFLSSIFGIVPNTHTTIPADIQSKIDARQQARDARDFSTSDRIRSELLALGYSVDDTPYGPLVKNI